MYYSSGDAVGWIYLIFFFIIVVSCCCLGDSNNSSNASTRTSTTKKRSTNTPNQRNSYRISYSECPSCGAPYYDGYCEECGYPDVNQGWLGENY